MLRTLIAAIIGCSILSAQSSTEIIAAASRSGIVQLIDPVTLQTVGQLQILLQRNSAGLNGISSDAEGSNLYVEGPIPSDPQGCCSLYAIDVRTLSSTIAAGIPGSSSRSSFLSSDGVTYAARSLTSSRTITKMSNDEMHLSSDQRWLFGVRNFRGPALDVFDLGHGSLIRQLNPTDLQDQIRTSGTWSGDRFLFYVALAGGRGRLWMVSPETEQLGPGVEVQPFGEVEGCSRPSIRAIISAAGAAFLYEPFGFTDDRRATCRTSVPGGAWTVDPVSGRLIRQVASDLHFSALLPGLTGRVLYGLSTGDAMWTSQVQLVRIDAQDGRILQSHSLNSEFWRIAIVSLRFIPSGTVSLAVPPE